jgi:hypothetical protein
MHYIPTPEKAVAYEALSLQEDHIEACGHYIAKTYGIDYVLAFPNTTRKLFDLVLSGFNEEQSQMQLYACFGFPLPVKVAEGAPAPKPRAKRKA